MLLRSLWCRFGTQLLVERKPVSICALTSISQSLHPTKYECRPRGHWLLSNPPQKDQTVGYVLAASGGFARFTRTSMNCGLSVMRTWGQKRLYSSNPVNLMLKPTLKSAVVPGKRVPKGPRTKQPSRTNQPALKEDKVAHQTSREIQAVFCLRTILTCFSLQDMMQCIAFATADQYHLPTLCHDLISEGFCEIDLPRGTIPKY